MRHNMFRADHNIVSGFDDLSGRKSDSILLYDLFDSSLRDLCRLCREQPNAQ